MRNHAIALATLLALLAGAPAVLAAGRDVINDCTDDEVLSKTYTQKDYRDALAKLPADADQYGNCREIIARAQESAATRGGSKQRGATGGGSGGRTPPSSRPARQQLAAASPEERAAAEDAARNGASTAAAAGGRPLSTGDVGVAPRSSGVSDLPLPVLLLLALLLAGALALAAVRVRGLVHARRG